MEKQAGMLDFRTSRLSRRLELDASLAERVYAMIAEIDGVKNGWRLAGRLQARALKRLVRSVIVTSTGASNRIEGNKLSDAEVEALYSQLRIRKFRTRDQQEVAGYLEVLESVFQNHWEMSVGESLILQLHRDMLRHSEKDERHAGIYKFGPNRVEAKDATGQVVGIIFDPTPSRVEIETRGQATFSFILSKKILGMHFIQPPQHIVVKLVQLRRKNAISGRWLSQVHTQKGK